jgi:hypothetical protein
MIDSSLREALQRRQIQQRLAELNRRSALQAGALSLLGLGLPQLLAGRQAAAHDATQAAGATAARAQAAGAQAAGGPPTGIQKASDGFGRAKACILLFMWGGPAHQDTWDMKPDAPAEVRGEFKPIASRLPSLPICEHFPHLATRTDRLCIVRSMTHNNADHTPSTHFLLTGMPPPPTDNRRLQWPNMGSVLAKLGRGRGALPTTIAMRPKLENDVPRFVEQSQGTFAGWLGSLYDPMIIDQDPSRPNYRVDGLQLSPDISAQRLADRQLLRGELSRLPLERHQVVRAHDGNIDRAFQLLTGAAEQRGAFRLEEEPLAMRERYGLNPHGQSVLQARRLVERGVPLVTVFWPNDGIKNVSVYWDTHSRNFIDLKERLMPVADQAFSALLDDLRERGMLDETLVVWTGEFGRTPRIGQRNSDAGAGRDGRDHWPGCFTSVLAGGGTKAGFVYGRSDKHAAFPAADPVAPHDLVATIYHLLGIPAGLEMLDTGGRPHLVRPGTAITDLIA